MDLRWTAAAGSPGQRISLTLFQRVPDSIPDSGDSLSAAAVPPRLGSRDGDRPPVLFADDEAHPPIEGGGATTMRVSTLTALCSSGSTTLLPPPSMEKELRKEDGKP
jgi:hypothetical protein